MVRWASSGAMALTGRPDGPPLGPPARLVDRLDALAAPFPGLDPLALLAERAAGAGLRRGGRVSCGGSSRLLRAIDGWLAVSLPRPDDLDTVPAWLELGDGSGPRSDGPDATWQVVRGTVPGRARAELVARAALVGLAAAALPASDAPARRPPIVRRRLGAAPPRPDLRGVVVVDLTSLWAGPLCGALLAGAGATVVKVEATRRPDGARAGPPDVFDRLNGAKRSVALDFADWADAARLAELVRHADVVLEASRPRALEQLGLRAAELVAGGGPQVWVSVTGYGRRGHDGTRVAFGDDAAVAGGLVVRDATGPLFCADAVADPASGLAAAGACVGALASGGRWLIDVAMDAVAADLAGDTLPVPPGVVAAAPRADPPQCRAAALGRDTAAVLGELGIP